MELQLQFPAPPDRSVAPARHRISALGAAAHGTSPRRQRHIPAGVCPAPRNPSQAPSKPCRKQLHPSAPCPCRDWGKQVALRGFETFHREGFIIRKLKPFSTGDESGLRISDVFQALPAPLWTDLDLVSSSADQEGLPGFLPCLLQVCCQGSGTFPAPRWFPCLQAEVGGCWGALFLSETFGTLGESSRKTKRVLDGL